MKLVEDIRELCLNVGKDAREAAKAPDCSYYDLDSYVSGYQDACVDMDEAIRAYMLRHDAESKPKTE